VDEAVGDPVVEAVVALEAALAGFMTAGFAWAWPAAAGFAVKVSGPFWPQAVKAIDATTGINRDARVERPCRQAGLSWLATLPVTPR